MCVNNKLMFCMQ